MTSTDPRFTRVPHKWEEPHSDTVACATEAVEAALSDPRAVKFLTRYYSREGNFAGATFLTVGPANPWDVGAADLLALTLLSVEAPPYSVRKLLEPSAERNHVLRLLSEDRLSVDADLAVADDDTLRAMAELHEAFKLYLSPAESRAKNPWVTASKLCARKRPDLFPVRDSVVCNALGLGRNYQVDWQVFRGLIQDPAVRDRIDALVDAASSEGADLGHPNRRLRHLDVLLWMKATSRPLDAAEADD